MGKIIIDVSDIQKDIIKNMAKNKGITIKKLVVDSLNLGTK